MSTNAERLARAVAQRREDLDLTQLEVWQAGGPSNTTLTVIENGRTETLSRTTARKLDAGLQWEPGSARRVWDGKGEPRPLVNLSVVRPDNSADVRRYIERSDIDQALKDRLLGVLKEDPPAPGEVKGA